MPTKILSNDRRCRQTLRTNKINSTRRAPTYKCTNIIIYILEKINKRIYRGSVTIEQKVNSM